mgnify:CR=1 FL=1
MLHEKDTKKVERKMTPSLGQKMPQAGIKNLKEKAEKIIAAIYMVSGLISESEPLRNMLRKASLGFSSELYSSHYEKGQLSFIKDSMIPKLELLSARIRLARMSQLVSEMNADILLSKISSLSSEAEEIFSSRTQKNSELSHSARLLKDIFANDQGNAISSATTIDPSPSRERKTDIDTSSSTSSSRSFSRSQVLSSLTPVASQKSQTPPGKKDRKFTRTSKSGGAREQRQEKILTRLGEHPQSSITDICSVFDGCSTKTIQRDLVELIEAGKVTKKGSRRWSTYSIV